MTDDEIPDISNAEAFFLWFLIILLSPFIILWKLLVWLAEQEEEIQNVQGETQQAPANEYIGKCPSCDEFKALKLREDGRNATCEDCGGTYHLSLIERPPSQVDPEDDVEDESVDGDWKPNSWDANEGDDEWHPNDWA